LGERHHILAQNNIFSLLLRQQYLSKPAATFISIWQNALYRTAKMFLPCETMRCCQGHKGTFPISLSFRAGQAALSSGVYKAIHSNNHVPSHFVIAIHGEIFPN
jgi:hypothetical protein